jgi:hypothetical protein
MERYHEINGVITRAMVVGVRRTSRSTNYLLRVSSDGHFVTITYPSATRSCESSLVAEQMADAAD